MNKSKQVIKLVKEKMIASLCIVLILLTYLSFYTEVIGKTEQLEDLNWTRDMDSSVGNIDITNRGKTVKMEGNSSKPGKNAIYIIPDDPIEQTLRFDYNIVFGDSFYSAGILLKVQKVGEVLKGYMLSFNQTNHAWYTAAGDKLRSHMDIPI